MIDTGHYYTKTGEPMHFVPRAKGGRNPGDHHR